MAEAERKHGYTVPKWMKLDNAATIYPATWSKKLSAMFRYTVTLTEEIDPVLLEKAQAAALQRMPYLCYRLRQGLFWCYFTQTPGMPEIRPDVNNPMIPIDFKENKHFLFRVRWYGKRIAVEFFHAITDGEGGITFLLTMTAQYLRLKYGCHIPFTERILDPKGTPSPEETEDCFYRYAGKVGALEHEQAAYHQSGTVEPDHVLHIITGKIPVEPLKKAAKAAGCTITVFLASVLTECFQIMQLQETAAGRRKKPIKIFIPINLRSFYPTRTMRNFSSYVNVGIESRLGEHSFPEIVSQLRSQLETVATEKRLNSKFTGNVRTAQNPFVRCIPMFIKKHILSIAERMMGDRYCSTALSNMGNVVLPPEMMPYVTDFNCMLSRCRGKPGAATCISYNGNLYMTFTRKIREADLERLFFTKLVERGIPVELESNQRK